LRLTLASNPRQHGFKDVTDLELLSSDCLAFKTLVTSIDEVGERVYGGACWLEFVVFFVLLAMSPSARQLGVFLDSALMFADLDFDSG
jgi:hypothetical protein